MEDIPALTKPTSPSPSPAVQSPPPPAPSSHTAASPHAEPHTHAAPSPSPSSSLDVVGPIPYGTVRRDPTFAAGTPRPLSPSPTPPASSSRCLIFALGSRTLRYGSADDFQPKQKAMAIAYRLKVPPPAAAGAGEDDEELKDASSADDEEWSAASSASFSALLPEVVKRRVKPPPKPKFFDEFDSIPVYDEGGATTSVDLRVDDTPWTDTSAAPSYITGDAALTIHPHEPYALFFPLQRGHLNVVSSSSPLTAAPLPPITAPNTSYTACLSALEAILYDTLVTDLRLTPSAVAQCSVVLSLPSTFRYRETFDVAALLLERLRVKELFVHNEAVLATYGSGLASACVVDVGAHVTRVCCVEDGRVLPSSDVVGEYGGDDLGELLFEWMKSHEHYMGCRHMRPRDGWWQWLQAQRAKEKVLTCSMREYHYQWVELRELTPGGGVRVHRMNVSSAAVLAPRALFEPALLRRWREPSRAALPWSNSAVVDIAMDDIVRGSVFYAFTKEYETRKDRPRRDIWEQVRKQAEAQDAAACQQPTAALGVKDAAEVVIEEKKEETLDRVDGRRRKRRKDDGSGGASTRSVVVEASATSRSPSPPPSSASPPPPTAEPPPSLSQLIAASIGSVQSVSQRRRLCLSILLTGATFRAPYALDYATAVLAQTLPPLMERTLTGGRGSGEEVQCVMGQKLVDVGCEAWKGGAVIAGIRLEALGTGGKDKWMTRDEWLRNPTRTLRERCPFVV